MLASMHACLCKLGKVDLGAIVKIILSFQQGFGGSLVPNKVRVGARGRETDEQQEKEDNRHYRKLPLALGVLSLLACLLEKLAETIVVDSIVVTSVVIHRVAISALHRLVNQVFASIVIGTIRAHTFNGREGVVAEAVAESIAVTFLDSAFVYWCCE
jgi:hypothetical protein